MKKRFLQMVKKRVLSLRLFPLLVCLGFLIPAVGWGQEGTPKGSWADNAASAFAGGTGTKEDPYQIATAEQLAYLAARANEGTLYSLGDYYILTNNIDLSAHQWVPIGRGTSQESKYFDGYFNGNGKTITGLYVDESTDGYLAGLFGLLMTGQVTDLTIEDAYVKTAGENSSAGILAGRISNSGTKVTNCHVSGTVESEVCAGGLVGYASYTEFDGCSAKAEVSATKHNIGGFIGEGFAASFTDCAAEGSVTGSWCCGGFAGIIWYNDAKAEHCIADVNVTATDWNTGGFVGCTERNTSISDCVALGDVSNPVTANSTKLGGFVGSMDNSISIQNCRAAGTVQGGNEEHPAGGFIGYANGTFMGCSFDKEKNPALNAAGEGSLDSGVTGEETAEVLANICEDYFGGHQYSTEWTVDTEATCTTSGSKSHHCERCGAKEDVTEIPALGHNWGEPVYTWSDDNTTCTAKRVCKNDASHTETATATVTSEQTQAPTCTEMGEMTYMATFTKEWAVEQTKTEGIPATGHHYVNGYCTECGHRDPNYVDPISYYNIYVENVCDGVEITTSKNVVREGGSISLYVEKDTANYTFDNFKVYYKRSYYGTWDELKEGTQPGEYPINNIWTHIYIKAQGAEKKEDPTGIESIEGVKVYTKDGSLYVQTPQREQVIIVSMSGAVVMNEEQIGLKQYHGLQPGIYIVRVGQTTYKLRLH